MQKFQSLASIFTYRFILIDKHNIRCLKMTAPRGKNEAVSRLKY